MKLEAWAGVYRCSHALALTAPFTSYLKFQLNLYKFGDETYSESDTTAMNRVAASTILGPHWPPGFLPDIAKNVSHSGLAPPAATSVARIPWPSWLVSGVIY